MLAYYLHLICGQIPVVHARSYLSLVTFHSVRANTTGENLGVKNSRSCQLRIDCFIEDE